MVTVAESALYPTVSASGAVSGGGADWRVLTSPSTTLPGCGADSFIYSPTPNGYVPVQLLERRPDVQARAALVQAHAASLQSAKTDLLSRFGMQFLGGDAERHFAGLPSFGATRDAGVLKALEDIENPYGRRSALDQRSTLLAAAPNFAQRNEDTSTALYEGGRKTFRDLLDTRTAALDDEDQLVQAQMRQAPATVQLYRALGGGW